MSSRTFDKIPTELQKQISDMLSEMEKDDLIKWIKNHIRPNDIIKMISEE